MLVELDLTIRWLLRVRSEQGLWGEGAEKRVTTSVATLLAWFYLSGDSDESIPPTLNPPWNIWLNPVHAQSFGVMVDEPISGLVGMTAAEMIKPGITFREKISGLSLGQLHRSQVSKVQVGSRIVGLQAEGASLQSGFLPGIVSFGAAVHKVGDRIAVYPDRDVAALGCDRLGEEFTVAGNDPPGGVVEVEPARAEVHRPGAIAPLELVANLGFVAGPEPLRVTPKEDAAVGMRVRVGGIGPDVEPEDEILEGLFRFELPGSLFHVNQSLADRPFVRHRLLGPVHLPPAVQALSVE